jgi:hypothetical protein
LTAEQQDFFYISTAGFHLLLNSSIAAISFTAEQPDFLDS